MEESLGLGKKSYGTETDTETWSWFRLPIPKPGFGRTLRDPLEKFKSNTFMYTEQLSNYGGISKIWRKNLYLHQVQNSNAMN